METRPIKTYVRHGRSDKVAGRLALSGILSGLNKSSLLRMLFNQVP